MPGKIEIRQFCQSRMLMAGDGQHFAVMEAELAGETQDLLGLPGDRQHDSQCISRHVICDRKIRVVDMITEFSDIGKNRAPYFARAPDVPAPTKIIRSDDNIMSTALSNNVSNSSLFTLLKN
jgi:hypothetical protein